MATPAEIEQQPPRPAPISEAEPPSGPAAALILAGGLAVFCMGLVTTLGEASTGIADALQWNDRVGPLSGKTLITVIVFALASRTRRHLPHLLPSLRVAPRLAGSGKIATPPSVKRPAPRRRRRRLFIWPRPTATRNATKRAFSASAGPNVQTYFGPVLRAPRDRWTQSPVRRSARRAPNPQA